MWQPGAHESDSRTRATFTSLHSERRARSNQRRRAADRQLHRPWFHDPRMRAVVPERERVRLQRQLDRAALAWLQADALESLQRLQRPRHLRADVLDIELRDFISG